MHLHSSTTLARSSLACLVCRSTMQVKETTIAWATRVRTAGVEMFTMLDKTQTTNRHGGSRTIPLSGVSTGGQIVVPPPARNGFRAIVSIIGTDWSGATGQGGTMFPAQGGEGCLTTFEIDNASGVTIFAPYSSGQSVRSANNVVEFGHYSWFNTVIGSQPGTASCPIMDWAQYNFSQSCTTPTRPSAGVTGIQPITGAYSQENSFEVLTDDVTNIGGTAPAAATTLFSWLIPGSGIGDYTYHCAFTFSVDTSPSKLGIAIQGNLNNTNPPRMQGRALVDTTTTAIASGNSGDITGTTSPTTVIEG